MAMRITTYTNACRHPNVSSMAPELTRVRHIPVRARLMARSKEIKVGESPTPPLYGHAKVVKGKQ